MLVKLNSTLLVWLILSICTEHKTSLLNVLKEFMAGKIKETYCMMYYSVPERLKTLQSLMSLLIDLIPFFSFVWSDTLDF